MELLVGNVKGKTVILVDDMIDTGLTVTLAINLLKEAGAAKIYVLASHGMSILLISSDGISSFVPIHQASLRTLRLESYCHSLSKS